MENFRVILAIIIGVLTFLGAIYGGVFFIGLAIWSVISAEVITFGVILGACVLIAVRSAIGIILTVVGFFLASLAWPN